MPELTYFDAHAQYGARPLKQMEERWSLAHLLDDLDLAGIAGALVKHSQGQHYEAMHSNERLLAEIAPHRDRLWPCWAVIPSLAGEFPKPGELVRRMADAGVRAAVIYPKTCDLPWHETVFRDLAEALAGAGVMLQVSYGELGGFETADRFLTWFAGTPVLVTDFSWGQWREVHTLMRLHANLLIEFSSFQANRAIEGFAAEFGWDRCLFGTGQPMKSPGAARSFLDFRLCSDAEAQQVAAGNLTRLLGDGPSAPPPAGEWSDAITAEQRAGQPLSCLLLDAHCHVLHDDCDWAGQAYVMPQGDAKGLIEVARRMGTDCTALMSWNGTVSMDAPAGNLVTLDAVRQFPQEFFGLTTLNPTHQDAAEMAAEIEKYHLSLGFFGLKPYQRTPIPYNHPSFDPWWAFGNEHHLYGLYHISVGGVDAVLDIAKRFPDFHCVIAHSGGSFPFAKEVARVANQAPNIYAELTLTPVTNGVVEWLVEAIGEDRVLYGTDAPMRDPRPQLGWVVFTRLPESTKRKILGENFQRILQAGKLTGHRLPAGVFGQADLD